MISTHPSKCQTHFRNIFSKESKMQIVFFIHHNLFSYLKNADRGRFFYKSTFLFKSFILVLLNSRQHFEKLNGYALIFYNSIPHHTSKFCNKFQINISNEVLEGIHMCHVTLKILVSYYISSRYIIPLQRKLCSKIKLKSSDFEML